MRFVILLQAEKFCNKEWRDWSSKTHSTTFTSYLGDRLRATVTHILEGPEKCSRSNMRISTPDDVSIFVGTIVATPRDEKGPSIVCLHTLSLTLRLSPSIALSPAQLLSLSLHDGQCRR